MAATLYLERDGWQHNICDSCCHYLRITIEAADASAKPATICCFCSCPTTIYKQIFKKPSAPQCSGRLYAHDPQNFRMKQMEREHQQRIAAREAQEREEKNRRKRRIIV